MKDRGMRPQDCVYMLFSGQGASNIPFEQEDGTAKSICKMPGWVAELGITACGHYVKLFGSFGGLLGGEMLLGGPLKAAVLAADSIALASFHKKHVVQQVLGDESYEVNGHQVSADFDLRVRKKMRFSPLAAMQTRADGSTLELRGLWGRSRVSAKAIEGGVEIESVHEFLLPEEDGPRKVIPLTTSSRFFSDQLNTNTAFEQLALVS